MRGALAILKYVPAVLCGLLVVAWVVSWFRDMHIVVRILDKNVSIGFIRGTAEFRYGRYASDLLWGYPDPPFGGHFFHDLRVESGFQHIPLPHLIILLLPFAVGPFNHFRFPLWSYFAWTALLAAELAYYLR